MQKELHQLRAELDRLRKREYELVQELFDVRAAAEIQSQKIDMIVKMQPVAVIDCLPLELLSRILRFALSMTSQWECRLHPRQKQQLAGVSRRWRDVILNTPSLWSTICTCPTWALPAVEMHVARSRDHPLDIIVFEWRYAAAGFDAFLHPILPHTHRWHSLTIHTGAAVARSLLHGLSELSFPCLKRVDVRSSQNCDVEFPTADNTPVLDQLILQNCRLPKGLLPSLEKLTTLTLCGEMGHWRLEPQSVRLPLLRSLTMAVDNPSMLLKAIIAPELTSFDFNSDESTAVFGGIPSAFNKVHYVRLHSSTRDPVAAVCQAFPNVRHFEMGEYACGFFHGLREKTDLWVDLECITLRSLRINVLEGAVNELREWFRQRKPTVKPLHVRFTRIKNPAYWKRTGRLLSMLYDALHEYCTFEVDRFPIMEQTKVTSLTPTLHMDLPGVPSCVVNARLEQDVPWRESTDDFQDVSEDESIDIAKDDAVEGKWGDWWADLDVDYDDQDDDDQ
ncbi:hypothetical protein BKA82DRAFT_1007425 [Pisolithus tinctorius]|uniref:F-box domain-containing protein n=1 Tax=Pisolithus tinctorius Marx 270 TaxID=870435 RepID=A0A0C3IET5_PISTI|nr:hypothetical protein BKA82DRAFT_1007425 [Pisolithus tinctorius]KIN95552.1 hypothetical protein M404DRAFT_1007425 [Pisolithus tinctorius Marx 270]